MVTPSPFPVPDAFREAIFETGKTDFCTRVQSISLWGLTMDLISDGILTMINSTIQTHRVSGDFNPTSYTFVDTFDSTFVDLGSGQDELDPIAPEIVESLGRQGFSTCNCTHCGSRLTRGSVYAHSHGDYAIFGHTCEHRLGFESKAALQDALKERRLYILGLRKAMEKSWRWGVVARFLTATTEDESLSENTRGIAEDMLRKLAKWLSLSRKQIAFMRSLIKWDGERELRDAKRRSEAAAAPDWTEGRFSVSGQVLSTKFQDNDFGGAWKMLVKIADGRKCWGSVPKFFDGGKGDDVAFTGTFKVSRDDSKFAFFSRPSKAKA